MPREVEITQPVAINDEFILNTGEKIIVVENEGEDNPEGDVQVNEDVQPKEESVEERLERLQKEVDESSDSE